MEFIKSVRVRKDYHSSLDVKVMLMSTDDGGVMLIGKDNKDNMIWHPNNYKKTGLFKDFSNDDFIKSYIELRKKIAGNGSVFEIIQDPWTPNVPIFRNYGFDMYYLNNTAVVSISWLIGNTNVGGTKYSDSNGKEKNSKTELTPEEYIIKGDITKIVKILPQSDVDKPFIYSSSTEFLYTGDELKYSGYILDQDILKQVLSSWNNKIPNYNVELCKPDNESCSIIEYKSPIKPIEPEKTVDTKFATNEVPKEKIKLVLPTSSIKAKVDTNFKLYIGEPYNVLNGNTNNVDDYWGDSEEYTEANFEGMDEQELDIQNQVSSSQIDSDSNLGLVGSPANIHPVSGLDALLKLAGDCAREVGKNSRVNYMNLRSGYIKGIHGLCPQGTLSVLYALTGVKKIGQKTGNAKTFSFNGNNSLSDTGYFNNRIRVDAKYFNNSSQWQIGDVIAVDYSGGKPYGHIQVWTGLCWQSDFKQNDLQRKHVDWNSVALWRLNSRGVEAVKKQMLI